jgi:hypothetical protein
MKQYLILFYSSDRDTSPCSRYYREFETVSELGEWCESTLNETFSTHSRYECFNVSKKEFAEKTISL